MKIDLSREARRTNPDFIIHQPQNADGSAGDSGNEHFLVFDGPDGSLMAVWTQSTFEGKPDQHIVFSRSADEGKTWEKTRTIAGANADSSTGKGMASWGFPLVSKSGRIYVLYNKHIGVNDIFSHTTGLMGGVYSDDMGKTWSAEEFIPVPRTRWDNPDSSMPTNWIVWQKPERLSEGKHLVGFTHWVSPKVRKPTPMKVWWAEASVVSFMRFENIDENPSVSKIIIRYIQAEDDALQVGLIGHPDVPVVQEPSLVKLPDGRIFCSLRATTGSPWYTVSSDEGLHWTKPEPLRYTDEGPLLRHPCSPCPIYETDNGEYALLYHNHDGHFGPWSPMEASSHRRPIWVTRGVFQPKAKQPLHFTGPRFFMDNDGVILGFGSGRTDLAMYASVTRRNGVATLWYPERKFFLLGKKLSTLVKEMES